MKPAVTDSNQRNELFVVVFDEKNFTVTHFEFWRVGDFHCLIAHRAAEHADRVRAAGVAFDVILDLKCDVSVDVALCAFTFPDRARVRDRSLENEFGLPNQLLECRRDDARG